MMTIIRSLLTAWLFSAVAGAQLNLTQILAQLPLCSVQCVIGGISNSTCALTDMTCTCENVQLQLQLSTCVESACTFKEQLEVVTLNQQLCAAYPFENHANDLKITGIVFTAMTIPIVLLRIYGRHKIGGTLWWDDYFILISTVFMCGLFAICMINLSNGVGRHLWNVNPRNATILLKLFLTAEVIYLANLGCTKISILLFYIRVFPNRKFKAAVWAMICSVALWAMTFAVVLVFQCKPINATWDRTVDGKCLNVNAAAFSSAGISIVQDLAILTMPLTQLWGLHMTARKKLNVFAMFSLGVFATATSIIRLKFMVFFGDTKDQTWDNILPYTWSMVECAVAMICACLPAIRGLLSHYLPSVFDITNQRSKSSQLEGSKGRAGVYHERVGSSAANFESDSKIGWGTEQYEMDSQGKWTKTGQDEGKVMVTRSITITAGPRSNDLKTGSEESLFITDMPKTLKPEPLKKFPCSKTFS